MCLMERNNFGLNELLGINWRGAREPLYMLVSAAAKVSDALATKKGEVTLNTRQNCTLAELAKLLAVLLTVKNCRL